MFESFQLLQLVVRYEVKVDAIAADVLLSQIGLVANHKRDRLALLALVERVYPVQQAAVALRF